MIYPRPKLTIFAEAAKTGEVIAYPDWARGWGITLEQTNSKPPMEWMNDAFKQLNTHSLYLLQNGGYEWDKALEYPVGAKVQLNNLIYIAKVKNTNINPVGNVNTWQVYGLQQSDISQLLDGTSKVNVASEDALRQVNSKAMAAQAKADTVGLQANQNTANLNKKVNKAGDTMTGDLTVDGVVTAKAGVLARFIASSSGGGVKMQNNNGLSSLVNTDADGSDNGVLTIREGVSGSIAVVAEIPKNTSLNSEYGWLRDDATGIIFQWRLLSVSDDTIVDTTFPIPFPSVCYNVQSTFSHDRAITGTDVVSSHVYLVSRSALKVGVSGYGNAGGSPYRVYIFAIGR